MKKNMFLFGIMLAFVSFLFLTPPASVSAREKTIETYDKGTMDIWAVAPTFFKGDMDVIVYSSNNPNGEHVALEEVYMGDNGFSLYLGTQKNGIRTTEGSYWAIASASGDDLNLETVAQCYIDTNPKSIYPDLDEQYESYTLVPHEGKKLIGYLKDGIPVFENIAEVPEGCTPIFEGSENSIYTENSGIPQIFCLFGDIETFPQSADEAELFFVPMMQKYIERQYKDTELGISSLITFYGHISESALQSTGHFDDYFYFYKPLGISLHQYMIDTKNNALQSLAVGKVETSIDWTVKEFVALADGLENSLADGEHVTFDMLEAWYIKESWCYKVKDWGWEYFIDTRNLERDENGYVCEDVRVTETSNGKLLFPKLGDEIPKDLPGYLGVLDTYPKDVQIITPDTPEQEDPQGESNFEVFPEEKEEPKVEEPPTVIEEEKPSPIVPIVVSLFILAGAIALVIYRKKKI